MINKNNINKDSIYSKLYEKYGEEYVIKAGYFENYNQDNCFSDEELIESLKFLCTPLPNKSEVIENSIILLNTGCYNPIHKDHIEMMNTARQTMESKGFHVLRGYFAPDADSYVKTKTVEYMNIHQRCKYIQEFIKNEKWLSVESYAGTFLNKDVNFTTIYRRLELYIQKYLGVDIPIYYVCGSDRSEFSYTFEDKCIVVLRSNYYIKNGLDKNSIFCNPNRILKESSTNVRKTWNLKQLEKKKLILRVNFDFSKNIETILSNYFSEINYNFIGKQKQIFNSLDKQTVSLDSLLSDKYKLEISRYYNFGGVEFIKFDNRIGTKSIEEQIKLIPKDINLHLFDDDTFTGGTFKFAKEQLKEHNILGEITIVKTNTEQYEVLDLRDFILGENSGLAIETPTGDKFRIPYIYPFVNPFIRASVINPIEFSIDIWKINYHISLSNKLKVRDSIAFDCFKYVGFDEETYIYEICEYYINKLG